MASVPEGLHRFAVIGDSGAEQYRLAHQMIAVHQKFPFEFVLMIGDNMYGSQGIHYFVSGGGGKLRRGDVAGGEISAKAFDPGD